jgi:6-pyruvoyltetrahydropterin/6-carboxytetrahydropterin synthase
VTISSPTFAISVDPGELHFNAAHFITFDNSCENLHGHNFHVRIEARGENDADDLVVDFVLLTRLASDICAGLNDKVLLPANSDVVSLNRRDSQLYISSYDKQFMLPEDNCYLLPVSNTTAEMLAWYIGERLLEALRQQDAATNVGELEIAVEEADRQWGVCRRILQRDK